MHFAASFCLMVSIFLISGTQRVYGQAAVSDYLVEIHSMAEQILQASESAAAAHDVDGVKTQAGAVFELVWGLSPGRSSDVSNGAVSIHGWKTRWQTDNGHFDEAFAERYGIVPPEITDVRALGILGRGRAVRKMLQEKVDSETADDMQKQHARAAIASLNNVIGWMAMDNGVTKGELQPRVDLTREWDSPSEFWQSTSDTGWLQEVFSQAVNIMKVDYEGDTAAAKKHAHDMAALAKKVLEGLDANHDGIVAPEKMEGGLNAAVEAARAGGWIGT